MIEVVIFDLDGVLTDTAELHFQSWLRVAEEIEIVCVLPWPHGANSHNHGCS